MQIIGHIKCDGCGNGLLPSEARCPEANGHTAKYCEGCYESYTSWIASCAAEESRLNRVLDLYIESTRDRVPLQFVPQDLPQIARRKDAASLLRLG